jgi:sugar lactone lactonase YvrE
LSTVPAVPLTLEPLGEGLHRPECVLATRRGDVFVSDWRGGVTAIRADGTQASWLADGFALRPNGIALDEERSFLIAHLGETGGVFRLSQDGVVRPVLLEVDGLPLPATNFVFNDARRRMWISVSTRHTPRQLAWRQETPDGFVVLLDRKGARIVADHLAYTNEVRVDPSGQWLYVVETFGRRLVRFPIRSDGSLGARQLVIALGAGCFPDGFAFDAEGGIWITSLVCNRLLRLHRDGLDTMIDEANDEFVAAAERAFAEGTMAGEHLGPIPGARLQHLTSVAFGGPDLRTGYLGSLHTECIYRFRSPVAGVPPPEFFTT